MKKNVTKIVYGVYDLDDYVVCKFLVNRQGECIDGWRKLRGGKEIHFFETNHSYCIQCFYECDGSNEEFYNNFK